MLPIIHKSFLKIAKYFCDILRTDNAIWRWLLALEIAPVVQWMVTMDPRTSPGQSYHMYAYPG